MIRSTILFKKIEDETLAAAKQYRTRYTKAARKVTYVELDDFRKLDLRVGTIVDVKDHPNADKLYVLTVDVGEKRQLVAALKPTYSKKELAGKQVIVIANLRPAMLRGVESNGMLLAAGDGVLVSPEKQQKNGTPIR